MPEEKTPDEKEAVKEIKKPISRPRWLIPLVTIVVVIFILWYFSRSCGETKPNVTETPGTTMQLHHANFNQLTAAVSADI